MTRDERKRIESLHQLVMFARGLEKTFAALVERMEEELAEIDFSPEITEQKLEEMEPVGKVQ